MKKLNFYRKRLPILVVLALFSGILACGSNNGIGPEPEPEPEPTEPTIPDHTKGDLVIPMPGGVNMAFIWIEPGTFRMGTSVGDTGSEKDEAPRHEVTLTTGFYLGKYEVTRGQWFSVLGANAMPEVPDYAKPQDYPVSNVSWEQCQTFIAALNQGLETPLYRLPSEAEWEYACRAGTTTSWSFGDQSKIPNPGSNYMWYENNSGGQLQKVGLKLPNPWGLYDMHGNIAEYVLDWYRDYTAEPQTDPVQTDPLGQLGHVLRGGEYADLTSTRSAARNSTTPQQYCGFRIVKIKP